MKVGTVNITKALERANKALAEDTSLSPGMKGTVELLILIITLLVERLSLNSRNSSKPPSTDNSFDKTKPDESESGDVESTKDKEKLKAKRKPGGQNGHVGTTLKPIENPDKIVDIKVDPTTLLQGTIYEDVGFEARQVVEIEISRVVTEYRAQILKDASGKCTVATFPEGVTAKIQYGQSIKAHAVYMSQFQMVPYERVKTYFESQMAIPLSAGSLFNFNKEAYTRLEEFEKISCIALKAEPRLNVDETGINIAAQLKWLHNTSSDKWAHFYPHDKRGAQAMEEIGILPNYTGFLCHDHWHSYYTFDKPKHALCNAHHLRELTFVVEHYKHTWAKEMIDLLCEMNKGVDEASGKVDRETAEAYRIRYRAILAKGEEESPAPVRNPKDKKRGRLKKEKHRNLLERFMNFEDDVLRFLENEAVPFTNNRAENDLRMIKVQQKISGCFRSVEGAKIFCRIRGYLLTCQKHNINPTEALRILFQGNLPDFCELYLTG